MHQAVSGDRWSVQREPLRGAKEKMARAVIAVIRVYQSQISGRVARRCAQTPSCSEYAVEAIGSKGVIRGSRSAIARYRHCRIPRGA
jgi:hypothetical protein